MIDVPLTEAVLADPHEDAEVIAAALGALALASVERPWSSGPSTIATCERLLRTPDLPIEVYDRALVTVAGVVYGRPDLVRDATVTALEGLIGGPPLPAATYRLAGEVLGFCLHTPAAPRAVERLVALLRRPDRPRAAQDALVQTMRYAATWAIVRLDLADLVGLAEAEHLAKYRTFLLHHLIERSLFADPGAATVSLLDRLTRLYGTDRSLKYSLAYLAGRADAPPEARAAAAAAVEDRFPLRGMVRGSLDQEEFRVLVVQNIKDGQGDEIVRTVPLLQALLDANPRLEVVLVTGRAYLYAHPRVTPVPIEDRARVWSVLRRRFDAVVDFYDPEVPMVNYDPDLEPLIQRHVQAHQPWLFLASPKGGNHFIYARVDVGGRRHADTLGLGRQRAPNIYETTFRLIAELGLPLRTGEDAPAGVSVLAGLPCPAAEAAWSALVGPGLTRRPVALVCPFGGLEPLKGYVERQAEALAERLRGLIAEGFFVLLLPNGTPWGSAGHARRVVDRLDTRERAQVTIAPDPAAGSGTVTYEGPGTQTVPYASYQMRLITYFVRFADLVVTVEGWMVHAAYCLGKPYRVLMPPYAHPSEWHPYGRTRRQDVVRDDGAAGSPRPAEEVDAPPLPEQPRRAVLLLLLRAFGSLGDVRAVPLLRRALKSEDRAVRQAAAKALGRYSEPGIDADLRGLLEDGANGVRATAAGALLERALDAPGHGGIPREQLLAYGWIGAEPRDWASAFRLGEAARPALRVALRDEDPVVRREAAEVSKALDDFYPPTSTSGTWRDRLRSMLPLSEWRAGGRATKAVVGAGLVPALVAGRGQAPPLLPHASPPPSARSDGAGKASVLILTPLKDAADCLDGYCERLRRLAYPHARISLGFLEGDSSDETWRALRRHLPALRREFRRVRAWKRDFGYQVPPGIQRGAPAVQIERRTVLARSRNHLLSHALDDEAWVLWLDVDVIAYPPDIVERLLATGKDIVQPHCVLDYGGPTFDVNGWRDRGRLHLDDLRAEGELVELDAVGGTVLLVRADLHRDGLVFPAFPYGRENPRIREGRGELETEGLGIMARDMGHPCWGMPHLEVVHRRA